MSVPYRLDRTVILALFNLAASKAVLLTVIATRSATRIATIQPTERVI
jgi:hypothetical protein